MPRDDARLRRKLEEERSRLLEALSHHQVQKRPNIGLSNHMADTATEAFDQAASLALYQNQQRLLYEVDAALARMDNGTYGICERCGQEIDFARLKAIPWATLCINCQQYAEMPGW
ncbi:MAG TPA: conjugal transfer protein TraR [Anaerolineae bacterium]|nr:conjugal transfer protein TraR [Anaerolineae bacterium]HIQ06640.1 conjugal transfer protein TraR [Anaerolineae bacterium]